MPIIYNKAVEYFVGESIPKSLKNKIVLKYWVVLYRQIDQSTLHL